MHISDSGLAPAVPVAGGTRILAFRLAVGLVQGLLAWALLRAPSGWWMSSWLDAHPMGLSALLLCTALLPGIALAQAGRMRQRHLLPYLLLAGAALCALGAYDIWRHPLIEQWKGLGAPRSLPSSEVLWGAGIGLFIVNQLLEHRERGYRLFGDYAAYVERTWMCMVQLLLSALFAVMTWILLIVSAGMFDMLGVQAVASQLGRPGLTWVVASMAFALGIHLTDVRPTLLMGLRNVVLLLLSWLLPLVVVLGWCFLATLPITGLQPLWATHDAARMLLWAAAITLLLVNAAYRDGRQDRAPALVIAWVGRAAAPMLLALGMLAAYALWLRVAEYGWTPQRIRAAAVTAVALLYGAGYTWSALRRGAWLRTLEPVNIGSSLVVLTLLAALLTPLADPARLAVNSQMARLRDGTVSAEAFDFRFLRSGRYGRQALARLGKDPRAQVASLALKTERNEPLDDAGTSAHVAWSDHGSGLDHASRPDHESKPDPATQPPLSHARIYPPGAKLPADFLNMPWRQMDALDVHCMFDGTDCEIYMLQPKTGVPGYILIGASGRDGRYRATVFAPNGPGKGYRIGHVEGLQCPGVLAALRAGRARTVPPLLDDLLVGNQRLLVKAFVGFKACDGPFERLDVKNG